MGRAQNGGEDQAGLGIRQTPDLRSDGPGNGSPHPNGPAPSAASDLDSEAGPSQEAQDTQTLDMGTLEVGGGVQGLPQVGGELHVGG